MPYALCPMPYAIHVLTNLASARAATGTPSHCRWPFHCPRTYQIAN
ncbi:MAG: hypothetical protein KME26_03400 [Oscillatoria princeps RMCB-10]|nr:hypothetical protein [Oscillatoria princeps RMCB-10]